MLLERETFLDVLAGPPGRLILVGGEAGVGKTALVRAFAEDRDVLWGACDPLHTPRPLGPLLDIGLRESSPAALAAALLDKLREAPGTVLVLEDVHWADEGTLDVLRLLGRRMDGVPGLAVVTFRDDESAALRVVLGELATAIGVERITLPPLSPDARIPNTNPTRSAKSRRATNASVCADTRSSHCASSTTQTSGCSSAASASRLRTANPTRK